MDRHLTPALLLNGYRLIRFLGRGGFGEVWLCQSEAMGDYRALKFISTHDSHRLEKEYQALIHYRKAMAMLRSTRLEAPRTLPTLRPRLTIFRLVRKKGA